MVMFGLFRFGAYLISEDHITAGEIFTVSHMTTHHARTHTHTHTHNLTISLQVFFAILIGAFSLGQAAPQLELLQTAAGAGGAIFETIDRVRHHLTHI